MWVGRRLALEEPLERPPCGPCTSLVCYGLLAKGLAVSEASSKTAPPDVVVGRSRGFLLDVWHYIYMLFHVIPRKTVLLHGHMAPKHLVGEEPMAGWQRQRPTP